MALRDIERLGKFPRAGAKAPNIFDAATFSHDLKTAPRLKRADEDDPVARATFDKHVEHPMHAVVKIDVSRAWFIALDECARARAFEGVARFVALDQVGFRLNDKTGAIPPNEFDADQICGANEWINLEEDIGQHAGKLAALRNGR
jgi:hypothetical protein